MNEFKKVGIIGKGVVGNAIYTVLNEKGVDVKCYDKFKKEFDNFNDVLDADLIYLCLPTLYSNEKKCYNLEPINETLERLKSENYNGALLLKSTVEPETTVKLSEKYGYNIIHNPEFLTARDSVNDFRNQTHIVLGINSNTSDSDGVISFYKKVFPNANISICSSTESEIMKIAVNSYYSVKIQYFNEIYALSQKVNADYNIIVDTMVKNKQMTPNFTNVPGHDGKLSYGGMCFPKDTNALYQYMEKNNIINEVLGATISERNKLRDD